MFVERSTIPEPLEIWGGHECTVNRVGNEWFDQSTRSGHEHRLEDLSLFASLGIRKLRYPALWERISPNSAGDRDFRWTDERMAEIRRLGMEPILTLCHHGSGPKYTSLLDENFAPGLAAHAAAVARRYPWVQDYTPVNEPLTTARFSALYGYWYPHMRDERAFWLALLNEIDATRLAMRAIRSINPAARLVQTDDLGFCHATEPLAREAEFQNERRWMGWDLLCGMVIPGHPLWSRLASFGFERRLDQIADDPCRPSVIGVNHYLSSERLLDHRLEFHVDRAVADGDIGDCDGVAYVDVDAIRKIPDQVVGLAALLRQAWDRYAIPVAITECHLGATRDDQARWFIEVWEKARQLRREGVHLEALTAWSLLGSYDWNRMVTRFIGHYEPGVFDIRGGAPRPTLVAKVIKDIAEGRRPRGPGLDVRGWWTQDRQIANARGFATNVGPRGAVFPSPLLILGDQGSLTSLAVEACEARGLHYRLSFEDAGNAMPLSHPWAVLDARSAAGEASALNEQCRDKDIIGARIVESDVPPDTEAGAYLLTISSGPVFTSQDDHALAVRLLDAVDAGEPLQLTEEGEHEWRDVYGPCLIDAVLDLLLDGVTGLVRLSPVERWSGHQLKRAVESIAGHACSDLGYGNAGSEASAGDDRISLLPPNESIIERMVRERRAVRLASQAEEYSYLEAAE